MQRVKIVIIVSEAKQKHTDKIMFIEEIFCKVSVMLVVKLV